MPLPMFENFRAVWVEKTKSSHGHGGIGWEFGTCLWSPTTDKTGKQIYKNMVAAREGDLVLHFYEDALYGRELDHYFFGASVVDGAPEVKDTQPPLAGEWANRSEYYRINHRDFTPFADAISIRAFAQKHDDEIKRELLAELDQPFINYKNSIRLAQGKYLSRCGRGLYMLLSEEIPDAIQPFSLPQSQNKQAKNAKQDRQATKPFDYEEYVEGQRAKREMSFFARNPRLVRDAKDHYGLRCKACSFGFGDHYPGLGEGYIEVHHLDPLSERNNENDGRKLTNLSRVTVLCSNCHRMIHRLIRKHGRSISIDEFKKSVLMEKHGC